MTDNVELLMLIGDKVVKLYEKDKEIKRLGEIILTAQGEIGQLRIEKSELERKFMALFERAEG